MDVLVHHLLRSSAERLADKEALVHGDERLTYREVLAQVERFATALRSLGLTRGDRVGIHLTTSVPKVIAIFGASQAGGVFVPINHLLFPKQVAHIVRDCGMRLLVTSAAALPSIADELAALPSLEHVIVVGDVSDTDALPVPVHHFDALPEAQEPVVDACIDRDLAALLYTSGSTGAPKGVMVSHAQVLAGSAIVSDYLGITERDRILTVLPFSFDAGLNQLLTAFHQGATAVLRTFTFAREIVDELLREHITGLAGVPTLWSLLAQPRSSMHKHEFPDLRYITNTGGRMPREVLTTLRTNLPSTDVFLMYGLTEAFRSTYLPPTELDGRPDSMGKAIPNTEIMVLDADGKPCAPGEVGELVHRGPTVSMGYWGRPDLTAERLRPYSLAGTPGSTDELVCYSGDLVTTDDEGFLYFVGRADAMIKSSGYRISPSEVEEIAMDSGWLEGAAAIGIPDDVLGQAVKLFVVAKRGVDMAPDALIAHCAEQAPRYMVPKVVEVLDRFPQTSSGKVDYPTLRQREET